MSCLKVTASRFSRLPGGVIHLSGAVLEDTGFYTCVVEPLTFSDRMTDARLTSTSKVGLPTPLVTMVMTSQLSNSDVAKNYGGLPKYRHSLIVFRMPTISLQFLYVYKVKLRYITILSLLYLRLMITRFVFAA